MQREAAGTNLGQMSTVQQILSRRKEGVAMLQGKLYGLEQVGHTTSLFYAGCTACSSRPVPVPSQCLF